MGAKGCWASWRECREHCTLSFVEVGFSSFPSAFALLLFFVDPFHLVLPLTSPSSAGSDQEGFPQQINWHGWSAEMKLIRWLCISDDLKNNWSRWVKDQWEIILLTQDLLPLPSSLPVDPEFSSDLQVAVQNLNSSFKSKEYFKGCDRAKRHSDLGPSKTSDCPHSTSEPRWWHRHWW